MSKGAAGGPAEVPTAGAEGGGAGGEERVRRGGEGAPGQAPGGTCPTPRNSSQISAQCDQNDQKRAFRRLPTRRFPVPAGTAPPRGAPAPPFVFLMAKHLAAALPTVDSAFHPERPVFTQQTHPTGFAAPPHPDRSGWTRVLRASPHGGFCGPGPADCGSPLRDAWVSWRKISARSAAAATA